MRLTFLIALFVICTSCSEQSIHGIRIDAKVKNCLNDQDVLLIEQEYKNQYKATNKGTQLTIADYGESNVNCLGVYILETKKEPNIRGNTTTHKILKFEDKMYFNFDDKYSIIHQKEFDEFKERYFNLFTNEKLNTLESLYMVGKQTQRNGSPYWKRY